MTHLSRSQLERWRDAPAAADRAAIVGHLAVCAQCSALYAELIRTQPLDAPRPALNVADFVAAGAARRVSPLQRTPPSSSPSLRWAMAAAAVTVLAVVSWQLFEGRQLRTELARSEAARLSREQTSAAETRAEQSRNEQLTRALEDERNARIVLERELARLREPGPSSTATAGAVVSLFLAPGRLRSGGETKTVTIPRGASDVRLLLDLGERRSYRAYDVAILNAESKEVWTRSGVAPGERILVVSVPARVLGEDDYEVRVRGASPSGASERIGEYSFTVLR